MGAVARSILRNFVAANAVGNLRNILSVQQSPNLLLSSVRNISLHRCDIDEKVVSNRFRSLPNAENEVFLTYVWVDGTGQNLRSKTRVASGLIEQAEPNTAEDVPEWTFDGSSTGQAVGSKSDLVLKPVFMCHDPFFVGKSRLVMCEVFENDGVTPHASNKRRSCMEALKNMGDLEPWFGMEQEYTLMSVHNLPYGFPEDGLPEPQGPYYCSVGAGKSAGRDICDSHMYACRYANIKHCGTNAEVLLGQWEYQVGTCSGKTIGDEMWLSRYILMRVAEEFGVHVSFDPKPVPGDWNGTGMHTNFSTRPMREDGGLDHIWDAVKKLEKRHAEHIAVYDPSGGEDNKRRLTGEHETASITDFSAAIGSRAVSVRIPKPCGLAKKGWLEDRRPSANADPYAVVDRMIRTCLLNE